MTNLVYEFQDGGYFYSIPAAIGLSSEDAEKILKKRVVPDEVAGAMYYCAKRLNAIEYWYGLVGRC